eukprot:gene7693-9905_t
MNINPESVESVAEDVISRTLSDAFDTMKVHSGEEKVLAPVMMESALSGVGLTLDGLRHALLRCELSGRGLTNAELLAKYIYIQVLDISDNVLSDFREGLALVDLLKANVSKNRLSRLHFRNSSNLTNLNASQNLVSELSTLGTLPSLQSLNLEKNLISSVIGLEGCRSLRILNLSKNKLTSLQGISCLVKLQELHVAHNHLVNLHGLEHLELLRILNASHNQISDTRPLQHVVLLQHLNLSYNKVSDETGLEFCTKLKWMVHLELIGNPIYDTRDYRLSMIYQFKALTVLDSMPVTSDEKSAAENLCDPNPRVTAAQNHAVLLSRRVFHKNKINDSTLPSLSIKFPVIAIGGDTLSETVCIRSQLLDKHNCLTQVNVITTATECKGADDILPNEFTVIADEGAMYLSYEHKSDMYGLTVKSIEDAAVRCVIPVVCLHTQGIYGLNIPGFDILVILPDADSLSVLTSGYTPKLTFSVSGNSSIDEWISKKYTHLRNLVQYSN